jgi:hypothetical protein
MSVRLTIKNTFDPIPQLQRVGGKEITQLNRKLHQVNKKKEQTRNQVLMKMGFSIENVDF